MNYPVRIPWKWAVPFALCSMLLPYAEGQQADSAHPGAGYSTHDTLSFLYGSSYRTPFVTTADAPGGTDIGKATLEFVHNDSWKYGSNFIDFSLRKSDNGEPALGGGTGALEVYAILRTNLSFNKIGHTKKFRAGPLRDVALELGANLESKNSHYAPEEKTIFIGPNFQFQIPRGFLNVGLHYRKEWNHQGIFGRNDNYDPNFNIEASWSVPVPGFRAPLFFAGFATYNTPKGRDSFGSESVSEVLIRPRVMLDAGKLLFDRRGLLEIGGGVEYWYNEYGKNTGRTPGAKQTTPFVQLTYHLTHGG